MCGTYIGLVYTTGLIKKKKLNENLNDILISMAKNRNTKFVKSSLPIVAGSEHMSFRSYAKKANKNMQICCFLSNKDGKFIHSSKDVASNCSKEALNGCIDMIHDAVKSIDLRIE